MKNLLLPLFLVSFLFSSVSFAFSARCATALDELLSHSSQTESVIFKSFTPLPNSRVVVQTKSGSMLIFDSRTGSKEKPVLVDSKLQKCLKATNPVNLDSFLQTLLEKTIPELQVLIQDEAANIGGVSAKTYRKKLGNLFAKAKTRCKQKLGADEPADAERAKKLD